MTKDARLLLASSAVCMVIAFATMATAPFGPAASFSVSIVKPAFGWVTLVMVVTSVMYSLRKRELLQAPGQLIYWKIAHVWTGLAAVALMFLHSGGSLGLGAGFATGFLTLGVALTGVWGIAVQGVVPKTMTMTLQDPVYKDEMQDSVNALLREISSKLEGRTPAFERVYQRHILPALSITLPTSEQQEALLSRYDQSSKDPNAAARDLDVVSDREREIFQWMVEKVMDIIEIRRSQAYQRLMNRWLIWHVGFTSALFVVALFHIMAAFYF